MMPSEGYQSNHDEFLSNNIQEPGGIGVGIRVDLSGGKPVNASRDDASESGLYKAGLLPHRGKHAGMNSVLDPAAADSDRVPG